MFFLKAAFGLGFQLSILGLQNVITFVQIHVMGMIFSINPAKLVIVVKPQTKSNI